MRTSFTLLVITALVASVAFAQEDGEWAELQTANAPPRQDHSGFQVGDVMYIFGGVDQNGDVSNRVFELDLVSQLNFGAPLNPAGTPPTAREDHSMGVHIQESSAGVYGDLFVFGGRDQAGTLLDTLFVWRHDLGSGDGEWEALSPTGDLPPALDHATSAADFSGDLYLFGGITQSGAPTSKLYRYSLNGNSWTELDVTGGPTPREDSTSYTFLDEFFIFGGRDANGDLTDEMWVYNMDTNEWSQRTPEGGAPWPAARHEHAMTEHKGYLWVMGGETTVGAGPVNEFWRYNIFTNEWEEVTYPAGATAPPAIMEHSLVYNKNKIYFYGGEDATNATSADLWAWKVPDDLPQADPSMSSWDAAATALAPASLLSALISAAVAAVVAAVVFA